MARDSRVNGAESLRRMALYSLTSGHMAGVAIATEIGTETATAIETGTATETVIVTATATVTVTIGLMTTVHHHEDPARIPLVHLFD